ncbi:MAG: hypothetical protein JGK17_30380 [Microcoleus sp. PH2017_10_PVI_O_A]|nr:hypothetical protein [Microcoleus sp. PH2017_10_PVI_O_A]
MPIEQKQAVYSMNYTNSIMLSVLAEHTGKTREAVASFLADTFQANQLTVTEDELNQFMRQFVEASRMTPVKKFVFVNSSKDKSDEK